MKMHIIAFILSSLLAHPVFCAENPYPQVPRVNIVLVVDGTENVGAIGSYQITVQISG